MDHDRFKSTYRQVPDRSSVPHVAPVAPPAGRPEPATLQIDIRVPKLKLKRPSVPRITLPKLKRVPLPAKYGRVVGGGVVAVVAVVVALSLTSSPSDRAHLTAKAKTQAPATTAAAGAAVAATKPSFTPVAPKDKPQLGQNAPGATSFDGLRDTYSYADTLHGNSVTVSQQPIPAKFSSAQEAVAKIGQSLGAKTQFETTHGTVYMIADTKSTNQTIVLSVNDVLVFLQSSFAHSNTDWTDYINSLQ